MKLPTLFAFAVCLLSAQDALREGGPAVRVVVTAEPRHAKDVPPVRKEDVVVHVGKGPAPIVAWVPAQGGGAALELLLLLDDGLDSDVALQFDDLRRFIRSQPPTAQVGVAYMRNGTSVVAQALTTDHEGAAKALRLPIGTAGISASPYVSLSDAIRKWPASTGRREVLMITSGIDPLYGAGPQNPYLDRAIADAQRAGIVVHSIYYGAAGHAAHSYYQLNWGQNYLSQLGDETGGEPYWQGFSNPVSFRPYLDDLSARLNRQYLLTFTPPPEPKGGRQPLKVTTELKNVELVAPTRINVPAAR